MTNLKIAKRYEEYIISMRRYFHAHPELTDHEDATMDAICAELGKMGVEYVVIPHGGVLGKIHGAKPGKAVLLRADCDALPVKEAENLNDTRCVWSETEGVMHACGHDGHMAMLLGAAQILLDKKDEIAGTVYLCFERGEELMFNVKHIFKYIDDNNIQIDSCYGSHVWADLPTGVIAINDSDMMASTMAFEITIVGKGGHGSRPDQSNSPLDCFTAIYQRLESIRLTKISPFKTCTYSIGYVHAGNMMNNVIPQEVHFAGTMRTFDIEGAGARFRAEFKRAIDNICEAYDCQPIYHIYPYPYPPTVNDAQCAQFARQAIGEALGQQVIQCEPWMASESFGSYLAQWPGVFAFIGINNPDKGTGAAHHNEHFDLDEDVLVKGACAHATYALEFLNSDIPAGRKVGYKQLLINCKTWAELKELYGEGPQE